MHVPARTLIGLSLLTSLWVTVGCTREGTHRNDLDLAFEPESREIDFGSVPVGGARTRELSVWNRSKVDVVFTASVGAPFTTVTEGALPGGARHAIALTFQPTSLGPADAEVSLTIDDHAYPVKVHGVGAEACASEAPCRSSTFDESNGTCHEALLADGTACEAPCVDSGVCAAGVCVGATMSCDDQNVCTKDACTAGKGCVHSELTCAPSEDPCHVEYCNPSTGCGLAKVADGTRCGTNECVDARVCIDGACVNRAAPDGAICGEPSPCQDLGVCQMGACVRAPGRPLLRAWSHPLPGWPDGLLMANEHTVFAFGTRNDTNAVHRYLAAIDARTGEELYRTDIPTDGGGPGHPAFSPALVENLIVDLTVSDQVRGYSTSSGTLVWSTALLPLLTPGFDTGSEGYTEPVVEAHQVFGYAGELVVIALGWNARAEQKAWREPGGVFVVRLNPANGTPLGFTKIARTLVGGAASPMDASGRITLVTCDGRVDLGDPVDLESVSPDGTVNWKIPATMEPGLGAAIGGRVYFWSDKFKGLTSADRETGELGQYLPDTPRQNRLRVPLVGRTTRAFYLGYVDPASEPEGPPLALGRISVPADTWTPIWTEPPEQAVASALLTDDGAALFEREAPDSTWLTKVGRYGEAWSCQLDPSHDYDDSGLLVDGMWISFNRTSTTVDAYAIPQERASSFGWIANEGSFFRDYRELP